MTESIIHVENIHHTFFPNSPKAIHALRGVSFDVQRGEYLAIIGHNGSGKSTLAKHLNGLLLPTQGDVWVKSWNTKDAAHKLDIRSTVGMVFQTPDNQIVATIVEEDVAFGPENLGVPHAELRQRVDWALDTVEMQAYRHRAPHLLSGGQKQRIAIAGILALKPDVLVLDESTALLDPLGRDQVLRVAKKLHADGTTIVAITHFMQEAAIADRVIVMESGGVAMEGSPRQVFRQADRLRELQLGVPEITQLAQRLHSIDRNFPADVLSVEEFVASMTNSKFQIPNHATRNTQRELPITNCELPSIEIQQLEHTYMRGTPLESIALLGVDFHVEKGEIVGIIGHTGSGKSTLIQHLNALLRPQCGSVRVLDFDLSDKKLNARKLRQRVGLVFQFPEAQLFEEYVGDDVAFGPEQMGLRGEELRVCVREAMDAVGLPFDAFKDRPLFSLSGGERRRAALAGVLAIKPEILVLDEPTAGLDPRGHRDILARLLMLQRDLDMTLVIVSHNMEDIARMCDRVYVIADGKSILTGTPREVFAQSQRLIELGLGVPQVTAAFHALRERGVNVRDDVMTVEEAVGQLTVNSEQ
ncbi:MAG: energy-coupling factor transporter ATPase [Chloroflexi bacterium]|nr:energy-coupling factor transporter ATPase [Chloroflexota bacterium]